jgi:3-hydroxyisobutyrate dehydrogenase-like beta-hydroxyacid dehydrogenase
LPMRRSAAALSARAGTLTIMVSGDAVAYETVRPALLEIGRNTILVGDRVGQGQTLKLVNNLMAAADYAVASECLVLGAKAGLDADMMVDVINKSSGRSFVSETFVAEAVLTREFNFGFRLELMNKDIRLALEEAEMLGTPMFTCCAARQLYAHARVPVTSPV